MLLLDSLNGQKSKTPPIWIMRQAGRYLEEYRAVRATTPDFISFCMSPDKACEVTLQPIRRFGFDAAIIFSDILTVPWAMDRNIHFVTREGPECTPLQPDEIIDDALVTSVADRCKPVGDAVALTRAALPSETALIGFAGAPWTLMTYMVEGGSSKDYAKSRNWLWGEQKATARLIDQLIDGIVQLLIMQAQNGANVLMLFDSWASAVPSELRPEIVERPAQRIIEQFRAAGVTAPFI